MIIKITYQNDFNFIHKKSSYVCFSKDLKCSCNLLKITENIKSYFTISHNVQSHKIIFQFFGYCVRFWRKELRTSKITLPFAVSDEKTHYYLSKDSFLYEIIIKIQKITLILTKKNCIILSRKTKLIF